MKRDDFTDAVVPAPPVVNQSFTTEWNQIATPSEVDLIVLLFCPGDEYPVWPGYFDGSGWLHVDGWDVAPTHWAELPKGPTA